MRLGLVIGAALGLAACSDSGAGGDGDYMDDDLPMGNCSGTSGACPGDSGTVPAGFPCAGTPECAGDLACVAPFADDVVGEFTCSAQCIPSDDEAWWCIDASACCDPAATCTTRGLCVVPDALDDTAADDATTADPTTTVGSTSLDPTSTGGTGDTGSGTTDTATASSGGSDGSSTGGG